VANFNTAISRHGRRVELWRRTDGAADEFGVPSDSWASLGTLLATRSYPNRNTTADERVGAYARDKPVFLFVPSADIQSGDRIGYEDKFYELQSPSPYHTHIEAIANVVDGFDPTS